jgi:hypothetical protein
VAHFTRSLYLDPFWALAAPDVGENWWKDLLRAWRIPGEYGGLRLALRNKGLNFYANGQSVAKILSDKLSAPRAMIHYKYVAPERMVNSKYVKFDASGKCLTSGFTDIEYEPGRSLECWISRASLYAGCEKNFINGLVAKTASVIDLEMGLPSLVESLSGLDDRRIKGGSRLGAPRVDVVCLEGTLALPRVVFWEVKLRGDSRLVSETEPKVIRQVGNYEKFFADRDRNQDVRIAYGEACRLLCELGRMAESVDRRERKFPNIVKCAAASPNSLSIDPQPRIVIYNQGPRSTSWEGHLRKLRTKYNISCFEVSEPCDLASLSTP